jgi:hypothetical protein
VEDARQYAKKVNAVLVSEITLENLLKGIEEAKSKKPLVLVDGAQRLSDIIINL